MKQSTVEELHKAVQYVDEALEILADAKSLLDRSGMFQAAFKIDEFARQIHQMIPTSLLDDEGRRGS